MKKDKVEKIDMSNVEPLLDTPAVEQDGVQAEHESGEEAIKTPPVAPPVPDDTELPAEVDPAELSVSLDTPVDIVVKYVGDRENCHTTVEARCSRNMWIILAKLMEILQELHGEDVDTSTIKPDELYITISNMAHDTKGNLIRHVMSEGPAMDVVIGMQKRMMDKQMAAGMLYNTMMAMLENSPVRGIMVTAIFEDQSPVNLSVINKSLGETLTEEDIHMMAYQATAAVDLFRTNMKKIGYTFPDESNILGLDGKPTKVIL